MSHVWETILPPLLSSQVRVCSGRREWSKTASLFSIGRSAIEFQNCAVSTRCLSSISPCYWILKTTEKWWSWKTFLRWVAKEKRVSCGTCRSNKGEKFYFCIIFSTISDLFAPSPLPLYFLHFPPSPILHTCILSCQAFYPLPVILCVSLFPKVFLHFLPPSVLHTHSAFFTFSLFWPPLCLQFLSPRSARTQGCHQDFSLMRHGEPLWGLGGGLHRDN